MRTRNLNQPSKSSVGSCKSRWIYLIFLGVQPLQDIDEVNMFKDDNTVIHIKKPQSKNFKFLISRIVLNTII